MTKICKKCSLEKDEKMFRKWKGKCKKCEQIHNIEWKNKNRDLCNKYRRKSYFKNILTAKKYRQKNKDRIKNYMKDYRKKNVNHFQNNFRKHKYGLSENEFNEMLLNQGGMCAICGFNKNFPAVDHNHVTGRVRGLLCGACNKGIGHLKEDVLVMEKAIKYLNFHKEKENGF